MTLDNLVQQAQDLAAEHSVEKLPPVEQWNPPLSGDIDIRIDRAGVWYHEGGEIKRPQLVKLFSSILKREGDEYFLVTPAEKWRIQVEDVPFTVVDLEQQQIEQEPVILLRTATDDVLALSPRHPLRVETDPDTGEPSPYVLVRGDMEARINRNTFYRLVDLAEERDGGARYVIISAGSEFEIS